MLLPAPYWSRTLECVRDTMQSSFYNLHLSPKPILISGNGTCTYLYPPISPICKPMLCFTSTFSSPLASLPRWQCPLSSLCSAVIWLAIVTHGLSNNSLFPFQVAVPSVPSVSFRMCNSDQRPTYNPSVTPEAYNKVQTLFLHLYYWNYDMAPY